MLEVQAAAPPAASGAADGEAVVSSSAESASEGEEEEAPEGLSLRPRASRKAPEAPKPGDPDELLRRIGFISDEVLHLAGQASHSAARLPLRRADEAHLRKSGKTKDFEELLSPANKRGGLKIEGVGAPSSSPSRAAAARTSLNDEDSPFGQTEMEAHFLQLCRPDCADARLIELLGEGSERTLLSGYQRILAYFRYQSMIKERKDQYNQLKQAVVVQGEDDAVRELAQNAPAEAQKEELPSLGKKVTVKEPEKEPEVQLPSPRQRRGTGRSLRRSGTGAALDGGERERHPTKPRTPSGKAARLPFLKSKTVDSTDVSPAGPGRLTRGKTESLDAQSSGTPTASSAAGSTPQSPVSPGSGRLRRVSLLPAGGLSEEPPAAGQQPATPTVPAAPPTRPQRPKTMRGHSLRFAEGQEAPDPA